MPVVSNHTLNWFWAYFTGNPGQREWDAYLERASAFMNNCMKPSIALHVIYKAEPINAVQRNQISDIINTASNASFIIGNGLVTDSLLTRGILTAINWIAKKPYPEKIFSHPNDAQPWFSSIASPHLCAELYRDLIAKVPPQERWEGITPPPSPAPIAKGPR
jgi:hypothetical protein